MTAPTSPTPLLRADGLARHYRVRRGFWRRAALVRALDGVSFDLQARETLAVVGESGCGKSTLARQLTMVESPTSGRLWLDGRDVAHESRAELRALRPQVQMVFQNPFASLNPRMSVGAALDEPLLLNTNLPARERRDRAMQMLERVGMHADHARRFPHMFSGGQRQRIAIARAMILSPRILIADEPVSALDVSIQAQILNLLMDLQRDSDLGCVFISHNLSVVEHVATHVLVMYLGRAVETGPKTVIFARPLHPYTRALIGATPTISPADRRHRVELSGELPSPLLELSGCAFHSRCPHAVAHCAAEVPLMRSVDGRQIACHRAEEIAD